MFGLSPVKRNMLNEGSAYGDFYNAIDNFFNDDFFNRPSLLAKGFRMDVKETKDKYIIEAELPGVQRDEIEIGYNNDNLYIATHYKEDKNERSSEKAEGAATSSGAQNAASETASNSEHAKCKEDSAAGSAEEQVRYLHQERRHISMQRAIYLPDINKENIEAKLDSGILTITVPKAQGKETEVKIQIQ